MRFSPKLKHYLISIFSASTIVFSSHALAGAFQIWEQSAGSLGDYHAGAAAEANNAGTVFYNPAGMSRIKHQQISLGAVFINLQAGFQGNVYAGGSPPSSSTLLGSTQFSEPGDTFTIVPNFHYVLPINDRWALGLEETTPFGASTNYTDINTEQNPNNANPDYVDALATETKLETINLNPSLSYAFNQYVSIGAGFDAMYGKAIYNSIGAGLAPLNNTLTGWGYGYNAGLLFQFSPTTRAGLSYRSQITIPASGPSEFNNPGSVVQSTVSANFPLPATTMFSIYHDMTHRWAMMASAFYTQWSCFRTLVLNNIAAQSNDGSPTSTLAVNENYHNTWNLAIGTRYKFNQHVAIEAGVGHDQTPTSLPYRDIRLPDVSRYVASLGLNIHPSPTFEWSMGWTHLFVGNTVVDNSGSFNSQESTTNAGAFSIGQGTVKTSVNVFGMQLTWDV